VHNVGVATSLIFRNLLDWISVLNVSLEPKFR